MDTTKKMARTLLILAVLIPLVFFLLSKYQDADFVLMIYEMVGENPAVALRGKVVWITGASSGIGEYLAYELAKCGCKLVLSARRKDELERVKKNCGAISKSQDILVLPLDLQEIDTHKRLTQDVLKHFGKVDVLVNNGGRSQRSLVEKTPLEVDRAILNLNTLGTISLTKAILPHMIKQRKGEIVIVSSILGKFGIPFEASYCATKHALQGYFDTARLELAEHNIMVQTILPGPVKSEISKYAYTQDINVAFKDSPHFFDGMVRMPTERCARLMAVSMANKLDEVWISEHPFLLSTYLNQYFPNLFRCRRNCGRANQGSVINHRMSDANTLSQCKSSMRSVKHLHPLLAPNNDRQLVSEANFVSVIPRCILVSSAWRRG